LESQNSPQQQQQPQLNPQQQPNPFNVTTPMYQTLPETSPPLNSQFNQLLVGLSFLISELRNKSNNNAQPKAVPKFWEPQVFDGKGAKVTEFV
ncbi:hypothetical protein V5O48_017480, partial [Marasmius crinis-equi]